MPANEIARKCANEFGKAGRQLDLVLFLDAIPSRALAAESTAAEFRKSVLRPRGLVETPGPADFLLGIRGEKEATESRRDNRR